MSVSSGDDILLARSLSAMQAYFDSCYSEFEHTLTATSSVTQNGDDVIGLFIMGILIETFGDLILMELVQHGNTWIPGLINQVEILAALAVNGFWRSKLYRWNQNNISNILPISIVSSSNNIRMYRSLCNKL